MLAVETDEAGLDQGMAEAIGGRGERIRDGRVHVWIVALVISFAHQFEAEYPHHVLTWNVTLHFSILSPWISRDVISATRASFNCDREQFSIRTFRFTKDNGQKFSVGDVLDNGYDDSPGLLKQFLVAPMSVQRGEFRRYPIVQPQKNDVEGSEGGLLDKPAVACFEAARG